MTLMYRSALWLVLLLAAMSASGESMNEHYASGQATAERLTQRFNDTRAQCDTPPGPAYQCSGVMLRGTVTSDNYYSWNPKTVNTGGFPGFGGVSFAYLRADSEFSWLPVWIENGFIIYPQQATPTDKNTFSIVCYFPVDGWTDARINDGCGQVQNIASSKECLAGNVLTAEEWTKRFNTVKPSKGNARNVYLCGFSTDNQSAQAEADEFAQALRVRSLLKRQKPAPEQASQNDEFRVKAWAQNTPETLPIEAFFVLSDKPGGLKGAQRDQLDYYRQTGTVVPVIELTLQSKDQTTQPHAAFAYHQAQQSNLEVAGCMRYIQSAVWVEQQLQISPTDCARALPPAETNAAFAELRRKYGTGPQWLSKPPRADNPSASGDAQTDSMRRQFLCLRKLYPHNATWNIETYRPYVSDEVATAKHCNP